MSSVYTINKGVNKPIEFKGLKAQYIAYLAVEPTYDVLRGEARFQAVLRAAGLP